MRPRRSPLRWLAPLALAACLFAVYSVVDAGPSSDDAATTRSSGEGSSTAKRNTNVSDRSKRKRNAGRARTYTVKPGDTLSSIAEKAGLTLARVQELNPELDSQSLQTGQRVKLSP